MTLKSNKNVFDAIFRSGTQLDRSDFGQWRGAITGELQVIFSLLICILSYSVWYSQVLFILGALLVYDVASRETFNALTNWLTDARTLASPSIVILLVGNKKDLEEEREVTFMEASRFAQENDLIFLETSAKTGDSVEEAFLKCSKTILAKIETGELDPERIGSGTYGC